ncbi:MULTISPECIES: hypothetical protein [unclassified Streptomyces]|uniref:hypothetical protein n=1 Tax=unclassified Streptomyces TaxID=2593676 RepID=UPI002E33A5E4|nr:hypothetical protein [Streptomyces sp. NBC_01716]
MSGIRHLAASVLLAAVYLLVITPIGLVARVVRDPLRRRPDRGAPTYWNHRDRIAPRGE